MEKRILKKKFTIIKNSFTYTNLNKHQTFDLIDYDTVTMSDILEICKSLDKGYLVVEVFNKDPLNQIIAPSSLYSCCTDNLNLYVMNSVDSLIDLKIAKIRHICIYTISKSFNPRQNILQSIEQSPFCFVDENYMSDVFEFYIRLQDYEPDIISSWVI